MDRYYITKVCKVIRFNFKFYVPCLIHVYIAFFLLLAFLGYGGLFWRNRPLLLILSIIATLVLILLPMGGDVVITTNFAGTMTGAGSDVTNTTAGGSDDIVLLSLGDGWEYTVWIWLNVAILLIHFTVFLKEMLEGVL
jgi:hypothetical protein